MDNITAIKLDACPLQYLSVGYVGETGARPVAFDFSAWAAEYGAGVLQLLLQRPGDAEPYPVLLSIDGTTATWTPDATDTAAQGQGQAQLVYTVGGVIVKNAIFRVLIAPSLGAAGDPPEPYESWLERLLQLAAETQQNAIDAAESAELAQQSAEGAADSDAAAAQSAADAEAAKTAAETAATNAGVSAGSAAEKAAQAAQSAQTAAQEASAAEQGAEDAQAAAWSARRSAVAAETAADNAEAAEAGANQAKTDAESAAAAAAAAVKEVERKGAAQITAIETAGAQQVQALAEAAAEQEQAIEDKGQAVLATIPDDYPGLVQQVQDNTAALDTKAPAIIETVGPAAVVTITDGAEDMPLQQLVVDIPATQSGSGDPSPENVRPFVARTAVSVTRTGESLIGGEALADSIKAGMPAATIDRTAQTVTFTGRTNGDGDKTLAAVPLVDGQRCTAILYGSGNIKNIRWQYADGTIDAASALPSWGGAYVSAAGKTVRRLIKVYNSASETVLNYGTSCILAGVKTAADFQPYEGEVVDIDWTDVAGAIYAGTLTLHADGSAELAALPHYASYNGETLVGPWLSSMDVYAEGATPTTGAEVVDLGGAATVYQLTAEQLRTLGGVNNIWSDAGDVTVEYAADTKSYVDAQTAALSGQIDELQSDVDALEAAQPKTVTVTGTVATITAENNTRYVCGEVATLDITLPASGIVDVVFESGSTPTVLTVTPPTGVTVRWANGFDPDSLDANTTYEINIADGLGVSAAWGA